MLTPSEALLLEPGRDLAEWLAVNILGLSIECRAFILDYSQYIGPAMQLEAKLFERGWLLTLDRNQEWWGASFARYDARDDAWKFIPGPDFGDFVTAATPAHAIARAAIAVIQFETQQGAT